MARASLLALVLLEALRAAEASCSRYIGCFKDEPGDRDLPESVSLPLASLTAHACVSACMERGYAYAGLQNDVQSCWCGNSYGKHGAPQSECDFACPGAPWELCGGDNGFAGPNSVYEVPSNTAGLCGEGTCQADGTCDCGNSRSGLVCEEEGVCRWGPSYNWDALLTDADVQDSYVRDLLTWDGRFAAPGLGTTSGGLSCDHVRLGADGVPLPDGDCGAGYTAASKESLHIGMLTLVVNRTRLAWYWIAGAADEAGAINIAVERLTSIIGAYEAFDAQYPGLGGFLPWVSTSNTGFSISGTRDVQLPALDNGQLAWSMVAAAAVLQVAGETALAERYQAHVAKMAARANLFFRRREDGKAANGATIPDATAAASASNRVQGGAANWPYEGEMMMMFQDMYGRWNSPSSNKENLWLGPRYWSRQYKTLSTSGLPNGPITVQQGWRFSAHELWKFMVLPYLDHTMARRVFINGEKARTWHSHLEGIPGLMASAYDSTGNYRDIFGINSLSMGFTDPESSVLMVTPYGAFSSILADRGYGLAWHRAMVSRPKMQSLIGSVEASQALHSPPEVAMKTSWDTKVTTDLAAVGGLGDVLRWVLKDTGRYDRFIEIVNYNYNAWNSINLQGEATPFAPPPGRAASDNAPSPSPDFASCQRVSPRLAVQAVGAATPSPTPAPNGNGNGNGDGDGDGNGNDNRNANLAVQAGSSLPLLSAIGLLLLWN